MSDDYRDAEFGLFDEDDENTEGREIDPGTVAFLDQESAEFNARAEHAFADRYGFVHKCRCDQDYTEGKLVEVTECYAGMTLEALDACATLYAENKLLRGLIQKVIGGALEQQIGQLDVFRPEDSDDGSELLPADSNTLDSD